MNASPLGLAIPHLFFVDDSILFAKGYGGGGYFHSRVFVGL